MRKLLNHSIKKIIEQTEDSSKTMDIEDVNLLYGTLEVVAGLIRIVQPGSEIRMFMNDKQSTGIVIDGGYYSGKLDISLLVDTESTITTLTRDQAKEAKIFENYNKIEWKAELLPDPALVNKAIIGIFKWLQISEKTESHNTAESMSLLLLMLLKINDTQISHSPVEDEASRLSILEPLLRIWNEYHSKAVEIPSEDSELEFCEAWRRVIDKLEPVLNYHYTMTPSSKFSKSSSNIIPENSSIMISEYAMPSSGYDQLPRPKPHSNESKAAIRLLAYWEKNIIPKIIDFVKSTYKPWEMEFYFEQLRFPLRNGDQQKALEEAMIM